MKKALLVCLLIVLFCTGCGKESNYTLTATPSSLTESFTIDISDSKDKLVKMNIFLMALDSYGVDETSYSTMVDSIKGGNLLASTKYLYELSTDKDKMYLVSANGNKYTLSYTYDLEDFHAAKTMYSCFSYQDVTVEDSYYTISAMGNFNCLFEDEMRLSLKTDQVVLVNNADEVNNNTYTWVINKDNLNDKNIFIQISKDEKVQTNATVWLVIGFITLAIVIYFIIKFIINKVNNKKINDDENQFGVIE